MKSVLAVIVALTAVATAAPGGGPPQGCKPATYACTHNPTTHVPGWKVCDVSGHWVFAGDCPPKTHCYFNQQNGSPYCI